MNILLHIGRLATICLLLLASLSSSAQAVGGTTTSDLPTVKEDSKMSHNLFGEFFGPSFGIGIGFDSRFKNDTPLGYRVGISYTDGLYDYFEERLDFKGVSFPLEINAIYGKQKNKFEMGAGVTLSFLHRVHTTWSESGAITTRGNKLNILGTINVGYRYQRERGFFLRTGFTIYVGDPEYSPLAELWILPNISFGYTFRY